MSEEAPEETKQIQTNSTLVKYFVFVQSCLKRGGVSFHEGGKVCLWLLASLKKVEVAMNLVFFGLLKRATLSLSNIPKLCYIN